MVALGLFPFVQINKFTDKELQFEYELIYPSSSANQTADIPPLTNSYGKTLCPEL